MQLTGACQNYIRRTKVNWYFNGRGHFEQITFMNSYSCIFLHFWLDAVITKVHLTFILRSVLWKFGFEKSYVQKNISPLCYKTSKSIPSRQNYTLKDLKRDQVHYIFSRTGPNRKHHIFRVENFNVELWIYYYVNFLFQCHGQETSKYAFLLTSVFIWFSHDCKW